MDANAEMGDFSTTKGLKKFDGVCLLNNIRICSQLSSVTVTSDSSAVNVVYQRKRLLKNPSPSVYQRKRLLENPSPSDYQSKRLLENRSPAVYQRKRLLKNPSPVLPAPSFENNLNFVYERRKHQKSIVTNSSANGACISAIRSDNICVRSCKKMRGLSDERVGYGVSPIDQPLTISETIDGYVTKDRNFDVKDKMNKTSELYSVDESCSSSMLDMDIGSSPLKSKGDDTDECSSSGALVVDVAGSDQSLSPNDLCVSNGVLLDSNVNRSEAAEKDAPSCSGSSCFRSCNVCGVRSMATEMLICDECEQAFHLSCFHPIIRHPPIDNWYCQPCSRTKHNLLKERVRKSSIIRPGKDPVTSEEDYSPISLMLQDSEPYITGVRVGKGFQAIVPEWCGSVTRDVSSFPEPMKLDPLHSVNLLGPFPGKPHKDFIGNWLQCRDIVVGIGNNVDGTICGKWRRAPLFEVQTDHWDCFRTVFWDPIHADCAAPQELETEEVLRQLKYIEMLRLRLAAKKRKLEASIANGYKDASNCTGT